MKTVKEISELTGISIRALRYYDEIGLLVPTERSEAGYRLYDEKTLEKLNAILFLRELDIPLDTIKEVVNSNTNDYSAVLKDYRKNLVQKIRRLQGLLEVVDSMESKNKPIRFEFFNVKDAEKVAETIVKSQNMNDDSIISEIRKTYKVINKNILEEFISCIDIRQNQFSKKTSYRSPQKLFTTVSTVIKYSPS